MKIRVDKEEYEHLLQRVEELEEKVRDERCSIFENWKWTRETLYKMMEDYFSSKCMTVVMKRDKKEIIAEVRKRVMDNMFKEEKDERN